MPDSKGLFMRSVAEQWMDIPLHPFSGLLSCVNETHKYRIHVNAIKNQKLSWILAKQTKSVRLCFGEGTEKKI